MLMRAASVTSLLEIKDVTREMAHRVRAIWKAVKTDDLLALFPDDRAAMLDRIIEARSAKRYRQLQRNLIDELIGTCGVEHLGYDKRANRHVYYCNGGDSYATTVCFVGESLAVSCWAYYVERGTIEELETY